MNPRGDNRPTHFRWLIAALALLLATGAFFSVSSANAAADGLTWKISQHAWASSSLSPAHSTGAPAVKDPANGFVFPTTAFNVDYNPATKEIDVALDGSATLGNFVQGGYRIRFDNPRIVVDSAGNGSVFADLSYCVSTAACLNPWVGPIPNLEITTFTLLPASISDTGSHVSFTVTPHWASVGNQFDQDFLNALDPSLRGHFRATGSGADPNKPPAPLTLEFDYAASVGGEVTLAVNTASSAGIDTNLIVIGLIAAAAIVVSGTVVARKRLF